jgi:hypothetical protein
MRKSFVLTSAILSALGFAKLLVDGLSDIDTVRGHLPAALLPYLSTPTIALLFLFGGYVVLLFELRNAPPQVDGVLYREYTKQRTRLDDVAARTDALANQQQDVMNRIAADQPRSIDVIGRATFGYEIQRQLSDAERDMDILVCVVPTVRDSYQLAADIADMLRWARLRAQFIPQGRQYSNDFMSTVLYQSGIWILGRPNGRLERELVAWLRTFGFFTYFDTGEDPDVIEVIVGERGEDAFGGAPRSDIRHLLVNPPPVPTMLGRTSS